MRNPMFNRMRNGLAGLAVSVVAAFGMAETAWAETELIVSGWTPPKHHFTVFLKEEWADLVEKESEGRLKVRYLPRAPMSASETFDGVKNGMVDISFITHGNNPGRFQLTQMIEMPFLANRAETLSVAYQRIFDKYLAVQNEHDGVVPLAMFTPGPTLMMTRDALFLTPEELAGKKIRVPGGMSVSLIQALNAAPVSRPASETYETVSGGIVDAALHPADVFGGWRLEEIIHNVVKLDGGFSNTSFAFVMNQAKYDSLSDEDRAALDRATGETFARMAGIASDRADDKGWGLYEEAGGKVHEAPQEMADFIASKAEPIEVDWAASIDASKLELSPREILSELRDEIGRVEAGN